MLGVLNVKQDIRDALSRKNVDIAGLDLLEGVDFPDISGLFIDWVTNESDRFPKQATIVDNYVKKGIPTVLFDRFMGITHQEYNWLRKYNVSFLEPAVINRAGFDFFPQWVDTSLKDKNGDDWDTVGFPSNPPITLGFRGTLLDKVSSFEKYYLTYSELFPNVKTVVENSGKIKSEWINSTINFDSVDYKDVAFSLAIGSRSDYMKGILPLNMFEIMLTTGCLVMLPVEHRFFGSLHPAITDERDLDYFIKQPQLRFVMIEEVIRNLEISYPEFTLKYAVDKLLTLL